MKFRNQVRLCLAIYDFEALLSLCLTFQGTGLPVWKKLALMWWLRGVNLFLHLEIY